MQEVTTASGIPNADASPVAASLSTAAFRATEVGSVVKL